MNTFSFLLLFSLVLCLNAESRFLPIDPGCDDPSICVDENAFANAVDPTTYCVCTVAGPTTAFNAFNIHLMPCAGGTCFNSDSRNCDSASCEETAPVATGPLWVPDIAPLSVGNCPSNAPNTFDCGSYIGCDASGNAIVQWCPQGQSFDGSNCVWWTPNCPADAVCAEGGDLFYSFGQEADGFAFDCSHAPDNYFVATYLLTFNQYFACLNQVVAQFYCCSGYSYAVRDDHSAFCQ